MACILLYIICNDGTPVEWNPVLKEGKWILKK